MTDKELQKYLKYYKGEAEPPKTLNTKSKLWWAGEQVLFEKCKDNSFWKRLEDEYRSARKKKALSGKLIDDSIPETKRIIIFFLDLWHGRTFPYDSMDEIYSY